MDTTNSKYRQLEAIVLPFPTAGHMKPMVDIARLFTAHGVHITIVTTPFSVPIFKSDPLITVHILEVPPAQSQPLSFSTMPAVAHFMKTLRPQIELLVMETHAHCIVSDMFFPWTVDLGIPRFVFHGTCCFSLCCLHSDKTQLMKSEFPSTHELNILVNEIREADTRSQGVLVNSFSELESSYFDLYTKSVGVKAWPIGPLHQTFINEASAEKHAWLDWLSTHQMPNSVLFISFGSMTELSTNQLVELANGLEASEHPFIWVLKQMETDQAPVLKGFEERMKETQKGLILKTWAPQTLILDHPSVGGFLTHCGWNSVIESITAGVPMITWPFAADQFINEKFVTEVIKVGVKVGVEEQLELKKALGYIVTREKVELAVTQLMRKNEEAVDTRKRAEELGKMARQAVEKGGSSSGSVVSFIDSLRAMPLRP